ncbi:hypothetical protein [Pseudonocardia sp. GCM10023141]|uniref:hypothetical protein n=1 Tax=Pseudonocardia sp. GCM10023141 TaxID=3252653 RepID=UPI00361CB3CC
MSSTPSHHSTWTKCGYIAAPLPTVWQLLKEIDAWPKWNGDVVAVAIDQPVAARSLFSVTSSTGSWRGRILAVIDNEQLFWGNVTDEGARWLQNWELNETMTGTQITVITTVLGQSPPSCCQLSGNLQRTSLRWLEQLKIAAERSTLNR